MEKTSPEWEGRRSRVAPATGSLCDPSSLGPSVLSNVMEVTVTGSTLPTRVL